MSISGIGSQNTYIYNSQTKKLATKDGSKDAFVDYFNGDISEEDDSLNGFIQTAVLMREDSKNEHKQCK